MKSAKYLLTLPATLMTIGMAQAKGDIFYKAPFYNVEVKPASRIYVDYAFDSHTQTLRCKKTTDDGVMSSLEWTYKDATRKVELPVTLKDDARFDGHWADPRGMLTVNNEFGPESIYVSCEYQSVA